MLCEYKEMENGWGQYIDLESGVSVKISKKENNTKKEYLKTESSIYMEEGLNIDEIGDSELENPHEEYKPTKEWYYYISILCYYTGIGKLIQE